MFVFDSAGLCLGVGSRGAFTFESGILLLEPLHAAARVNQLLLAGEERMALGTDFHVQDVALVSGARLESAATSADDSDLVIRGVNLVLHKTPYLPLVQTSILAASPESFKLSFFWVVSQFERSADLQVGTC